MNSLSKLVGGSQRKNGLMGVGCKALYILGVGLVQLNSSQSQSLPGILSVNAVWQTLSRTMVPMWGIKVRKS